VSDALDTAGTVAEADLDAWRRHGADPGDPGALRERLAAGTLPAVVASTAAERADHPALDIDGEQVTHGELDTRAGRVAAWLLDGGVAAGDRVLLCAPSSVDLVAAYLGVLRAGAVVVPAGTGSARPELAHLATDSGAVLALAEGPAAEHLRAIAGDGLTDVVPVAAPGDHAGAPAPAPELDPDAPALLAYTSGTTGTPKGVALTHANLLSSIRSVMLAWRWSPDDLLVHALPLSHQHGLGGVHATLIAGSTAVLHSRFDPARLAATTAEAGATVLMAVPAMHERLAALDDHGGLGALRLVVSGSAPLSPDLAERLAAVYGDLPLERYGLTETGLDVGNPYDGPRRPGTVGLALPGVEVAIADGEGRRLGPGEDGEIVMRGPQVVAGYWERPDATRESFFPGRWFRTGDIGRVDPDDGYLSITGRSKELIVSGGMNVYPREVELACEQHPGVAAAAVVGVPSERWGEEVVAFVVAGPDGAPDAEELRAFARERIAAYKLPKRVLPIDELPRNAMGKLDRRTLEERAGS
jgi:malonyl-CoA/methylmalonyl-CoA synthetase